MAQALTCVIANTMKSVNQNVQEVTRQYLPWAGAGHLRSRGSCRGLTVSGMLCPQLQRKPWMHLSCCIPARLPGMSGEYAGLLGLAVALPAELGDKG